MNCQLFQKSKTASTGPLYIEADTRSLFKDIKIHANDTHAQKTTDGRDDRRKAVEWVCAGSSEKVKVKMMERSGKRKYW